MVLKNDIIIFTVQTRTDKTEFKTYSEAETYAKTLEFAYVNIKASNLMGDSSFSASVSKVKHGRVEMIHSRYAINSPQVLK
jgi:hypothetical protein